jgi:lipopolysaccharide/colanic/teichoic acid biosynthesis glycosyltransferase
MVEAAWVRFVRRTMDVVVAATVLLVTFPVVVVAVVAIRLDSPGPALFLQERVGRGGRRFRMVKLRGMYADARQRFPDLYAYDGDGHKTGTFRFHADADPRVTRVGRFLRRTSIDELPNFLNVLVGDMSVVGPRPDIPELMPLYGDRAATVLAVRPGVTSLPKAQARDDLSFAETLALEVHYVHTRSLLLDLKIMALTVPTVLRQRNVSPG